jgi:two-component system, OmpR family, sensor histidine kinase ChvG
MGLGLYIGRLIAEYHAGRLTAENLPGGEGVRFTATLRDRRVSTGAGNPDR